MIWQDFVIGTVSLLFPILLVPSFVQRKFPSLWTSIPTGLALLVIAGVMVTLNCMFSAAVTAVTAGAWLLLAGLTPTRFRS